MTNAELGQLVLRIREGDKTAFMLLYESTYKSVFYHAGTILKNKEDVEDAVQETYLQAYKNIGKLQVPDAAGGWLNGICTNISLKKANSTSRKSAYSIDDEDFFEEPAAEAELMPDSIAERQSTRELIGSMIESLPDVQRATVIMFYYDDMSVRQIAEQMGCSENTVKSRLNYARAKLGDKLRAEEKRSGVKFYSFSPFALVLAVRTLVESARVDPQSAAAVKASIAGAAGMTGAAVSAAGAGAAGTSAATTAGSSAAAAGTASAVGAASSAAGTAGAAAAGLGAKTIAVIAAGILTVGAITGTVVYRHNHPAEEPAAAQEAVIEEPVSTPELFEQMDLIGSTPAEPSEEASDEGLSEDELLMYSSYYTILSGLAQSEGVCPADSQGTGLAYAEILDFDGDGAGELYLYYIDSEWDDFLERENPSVHEEVWYMEDGAPVRVAHGDYSYSGLNMWLGCVLNVREDGTAELWHRRGSGHMGSDSDTFEIFGGRGHNAVDLIAEEGYASTWILGESEKYAAIYPDLNEDTGGVIYTGGSVILDGTKTEYPAADYRWYATDWDTIFSDVSAEVGSPHWYAQRYAAMADDGQELYATSDGEDFGVLRWRVNDVQGLIDRLKAYTEMLPASEIPAVSDPNAVLPLYAAYIRENIFDFEGADAFMTDYYRDTTRFTLYDCNGDGVDELLAVYFRNEQPIAKLYCDIYTVDDAEQVVRMYSNGGMAAAGAPAAGFVVVLYDGETYLSYYRNNGEDGSYSLLEPEANGNTLREREIVRIGMDWDTYRVTYSFTEKGVTRDDLDGYLDEYEILLMGSDDTNSKYGMSRTQFLEEYGK